MTVSDLDICRTAKVIINGHSGSAFYLARAEVEECSDPGNRVADLDFYHSAKVFIRRHGAQRG